MGAIVEFFMPLIFNVVFYGMGRLVIPVLSLGHARAENAGEVWKSQTFIYARRDGKVVFSEPATSVIGLAFLILLGILYHYFSQ